MTLAFTPNLQYNTKHGGTRHKAHKPPNPAWRLAKRTQPGQPSPPIFPQSIVSLSVRARVSKTKTDLGLDLNWIRWALSPPSGSWSKRGVALGDSRVAICDFPETGDG
jgi:hypothetical protein